MKKLIIPAIALTMGISSPLFAAGKSNAKMSDTEKQSYAAGFAQGAQVGKMNTDLSLEIKFKAFLDGFTDGFDNKESKLKKEEVEKALSALNERIMEKQSQFLDQKFKANKKEGEDFLAKVKKDKAKSIKELDNGILYEVVKSSSKGKNPTLNDTVVVSYTGKLINDTVFDTTNKSGSDEKAELKLNDLISGWKTALQKMRPGDKWKLYIPYDQAYGEQGAPGIMPYSTLIFEIELHDVV